MVKGYILYNFNSHKFVKVCFVTQHMVYFVMFHMHLKRIYVLLFWDCRFQKSQLTNVGWHSFSWFLIHCYLSLLVLLINKTGMLKCPSVKIYSILPVYISCSLNLFFPQLHTLSGLQFLLGELIMFTLFNIPI